MMGEGVAGAIEADVGGERHREVAGRHRNDAARWTVDDRDRTTPIALARDAPVAQAIDDRPLAGAVRFEALADAALGVGDAEAVEEIRVEDRAVLDIGDVADREIGRRGIL